MIKRILTILLALAVFLSCICFAFAEDEQLDDNEYIKVGLFWGKNSKSTVTLISDYGFILYDQNGNYIQDISDTEITIELDSEYLAHKEGRIFMSAAENPDDRLVTLVTDDSKKVYRDAIWLYENNGLRIINYISIEHYVWGVVNKEMSSKNPLEALKAQAVAARTYALRAKLDEDGAHKGYGFDVCATTDCQVYGAYSSESSVTTQACRETAGLIMTYDGEPIHAYFSANSGGGYTMSRYDAWGQDDLPYLKSVPDKYTPEHNWETDYKFSTIRSRIQSYYSKDIGEVTKFEITKTNYFGAVTQIVVTGTNSSIVIPRSQIMRVFNLKSTFFCIGNDGYKEIERIESTPDTYYVLSADGKTEISTDNIYVFDGNTTSKLEKTYSTTYKIENDVCTDGMVYMRGIGYGHGIGMSQNGAINMAKNYGMDYVQILNYYYTGITIESFRNL